MVRTTRLLTLIVLVLVAGSASSAAERETKGKPAPSPGPKASASPDLSVSLRAPAQVAAGQALGSIHARVQNRGERTCDSYSVELVIRRFDGRGDAKRLGSQSGKALKPGAQRSHTFEAGALETARRYELCGRVSAHGDRVSKNDESCQPLVISAAPSPSGTPSRPPSAVQKKKAPERPGTVPHAGAAPQPTVGFAPTQETEARASVSSMTVSARRQKVERLRRVRQQAVVRARSLFHELAWQSSPHGRDCDDERPDVNPHATEVCDGADNDCDGEVDEDQTILAYADADGDGHGDPNTAIDVCPSDFRDAQEEGAWLSMIGNDCDDADPDRWHDCD